MSMVIYTIRHRKLDKAETARNATKKTRARASKTLKSATADAESTGNTLTI